jgi:glycerate kinase
MLLVVRRVLVSPDSFKGTLRATEVAAALGRGLEAGGLSVDLCPVADGGEGTQEVLLLALGGKTGGATVTGPLGAPVRAGYALLDEGAGALVEMAAASGLALVDAESRDAEAASSRGAGELILAAAATGAEVIFVAAGGSATTDGGAGALEAIAEGGGLQGVQLVVLCDVRTPWEDAARVFAPQKGAGAEAVKRLSTRLDRLAGRLPRDPRGLPFTGAAGGLAGGLWAQHGARLESGAAFVLSALGFEERMLAARAVVVGEGRIDEQTLRGKIAGEIATRARQKGVPAHAVVGQNALDPFEQRILDLGAIIEAGTPAELEAAGTALAELV